MNKYMMETFLTPQQIKEKFPITPEIKNFIDSSRDQVRRILNREDNRLIVIVGPCSIHNIDEALDYAKNLKKMAENISDHLLVIMRVYFEKPRTSVGWKGLINDPHLNDTCDLELGLTLARKLLLNLAKLQLPAATEFLDILTPNYISDLVTWGCIGARTVESQTHRQMASSLPLPIGFKNGTTGSFKIAVDGILAAQHEHSYLGVNDEGQITMVTTPGNPDGHLVLRGGWDGPIPKPNYYAEDIQHVSQLMQYSGLKQNLIVDCSHGNSKKNHKKQGVVADYLAEQISKGNQNILGVMLESNIHEGRQDNNHKTELKYGVSITDACIDLTETGLILDELVLAIRKRKN